MISGLSEGAIELFAARGRADAATWLRTALADTRAHALAIRFAQAGRSLGRDWLNVDSHECLRHGLPQALAGGSWRSCDLARIALLASALARMPAPEHLRTVADLLRRGELDERESLLRGLSLLPDPARFAALAIDACRTNAISSFAAIACENPYPATYFGDAAFRQMVLKAVFLGVPVTRIVGLEARTDTPLRRMAFAYAAERSAAGRSVPADIDLLIHHSKA